MSGTYSPEGYGAADRLLVKESYTETMQVDGEWLVLDMARHTVTKLNELGAFVWSLLDKDSTYSELVSRVREVYDISGEMASDDIRRFIDELSQVGLIRNG